MLSFRTGGIVPIKASIMHRDNLESVTNLALERSGRSLDEIGCVAVTIGPGLQSCLREGIGFAKKLAKESEYE